MDITKKNVLNKKNIKVQLEEHIIWLIISYACDRNPIFKSLPQYSIITLSSRLHMRRLLNSQNKMDPYLRSCSYCNIPIYIIIQGNYVIYPIELKFQTRVGYIACLSCISNLGCYPPNGPYEIHKRKWDKRDRQYLIDSIPFSN